MKKNYQKPTAMIAEMSFAEHITAQSGCHDAYVNLDVNQIQQCTTDAEHAGYYVK